MEGWCKQAESESGNGVEKWNCVGSMVEAK